MRWHLLLLYEDEHVQRRKSEGLSNFEQDGNGWATIALTPRYPPRHPLLPPQTGVRMQVIRWWDGCRQSESELKEATWSRMVHLVAAIEDSVIAPISQLLGHEAWDVITCACVQRSHEQAEERARRQAARHLWPKATQIGLDRCYSGS